MRILFEPRPSQQEVSRVPTLVKMAVVLSGQKCAAAEGLPGTHHVWHPPKPEEHEKGRSAWMAFIVYGKHACLEKWNLLGCEWQRPQGASNSTLCKCPLARDLACVAPVGSSKKITKQNPPDAISEQVLGWHSPSQILGFQLRCVPVMILVSGQTVCTAPWT